MKRFVEGADRGQSTLLPECLDDWIDEENPVRAIDTFVEALDLKELGFDGVDPAATGRPSFHPSVLLKLYIYGYLNRVRSSRRLEMESYRNLEVVWLLRSARSPIQDHRRLSADNRARLPRSVFRAVRTALPADRTAMVASCWPLTEPGSRRSTTGSQLHARTRWNDFIRRGRGERAGRISAAAGRGPTSQEPTERAAAAHEKPGREDRRAPPKTRPVRRDAGGSRPHREHQISLTDPDSRAMAAHTKALASGYNIQIAVDAKNNMIVDAGCDQPQARWLATWARWKETAELARAILDVENIGCRRRSRLLQDRRDSGLRKGGADAPCPKPMTSGAKSEGGSARTSSSMCTMTTSIVVRLENPHYRSTNHEEVRDLRRSRLQHAACPACPLRSRCTTGPAPGLAFGERGGARAGSPRLDENPQAIRQRREIVEHPFGSIKARMGATHFLMKRLPRVAAEMALHVLAYNLTRVMNIIGIKSLIAAIRA